jgi:hypothetical protein
MAEIIITLLGRLDFLALISRKAKDWVLRGSSLAVHAAKTKEIFLPQITTENALT